MLRKSVRLIVAGFVSLTVGIAPLQASERAPLAIGNEVQVLVDDHVIESRQGLVRRITPFAKHPANPVVRADRPWEDRHAIPITVMYDADEGLYRMWYSPALRKMRQAYAVSRDGIHWDKPNLGLVDIKGSRDNNMLALEFGPAWNGVVKDAHEGNPARRFKMLGYLPWKGSNGLFLFVSPDGLNWKRLTEEPMIERVADGHTLMGWDERLKRYVAYVRPDLAVRTISRITSTDLVHWTPMESVLAPDDVDPPATQLYGMSVFPDRGVYYGLLWVYHPNALTIDVQLAFSRDGIKWQRAVHRHPILSFGLPNEFDASVLVALQPIISGDKLLLYYLAEDKPHAIVFPNEVYPPRKSVPSRAEQEWLKTRRGYAGLATGSRDRLVSLDAGAEPGELVTKPFKLEGRKLQLNADAVGGEIRVSVEDENGKPVPGFSVAHAVPVTGDGRDLAVRWESQKDFAALRGRTIKLRVQVRKARIYAFHVLP